MSEEECRKVAVECQGDREMIFEDGEILSEILETWPPWNTKPLIYASR